MKTLLALTLTSILSAQSLNLTPAKWQTFLFFAQPDNVPLSSDNGAMAFDFPTALSPSDPNRQYIDYLYTHVKTAISGSITVNLQVVAAPGTVFDWHSEDFNTCDFPAHVRAYWEAAGGGRWWSNPASYELADGSATILVPLIPGMWSNATGQMGDSSQALIDQFNKDRKHATILGLSFGGGCFFGHGVAVSSGSARFRLMGYTIQ